MSNIKGHLEIIKKYRNGDEVVVEDDHNVIVSGMGLTLNLLFSGSGSSTITDYQISRAQIGSGTGDEVSATFTLKSPAPDVNQPCCRHQTQISTPPGVLLLLCLFL